MPRLTPYITPTTLGLDGTWRPQDSGYIAWSFDPAAPRDSTIPSTQGGINLVRLKLAIAESITSVTMYVASGGSVLTASQNLVALYQAGSLLGTTGDQSGTWTSGGEKVMALTGGPIAVAAGDLIIAFVCRGTTLPGFVRGTNTTANVGLGATASRFGITADNVTTAFPGTLGTVVANDVAWWVSVK